ncbi:Aldehyde dehydrogenase [Heracleum sosnowskyi]|uniref:Aldehyde dehydrogenase n=1 Tax=Heracleum sosnowskyi TaxID=360622 RepID=A0AAD8HW67_9APIA|nr:Aldehyde dehydrogenase [Heracleum sosnowskyi]
MELSKSLSELKQTFKTGKTKDVEWRKSQLKALIKLLDDNENQIFQALERDLGKHPVEAFRDEIGILKKSAKFSLSCIDKWISPTKKQVPLLFYPSKGAVQPEPLGLVLIFSSWNFPFTLSLDPLIGAVSAGNTVVLKPSELAAECSAFLAKTIPLYLDSKAIKVIEGGVVVAEKLLQQKWDKIFFTGNARVARSVMCAASKHLTPVTMELGGKCPTIFDSLSDGDMKVAVKRIASGKWGPCSGQACVGIDYILVEHKYASNLIDLLKKTIKRFYGEDKGNFKNLCKIVNKHHFNRLRNLLEDPAVAASIVYGGSLDEENLFIEPTILLDPPVDAAIMEEEIFGPFLPIITLDDIHESIEFINSREKPLTIYAFTKDESLKKQILAETSSGSVTFNDTFVLNACDNLPFGGVGESGFGRYHGKYSFDTFSHEKAVLERTFYFELEGRHPPWNDFKMQFIRLAYNYDYFGLVLLLLGLKRKFT